MKYLVQALVLGCDEISRGKYIPEEEDALKLAKEFLSRYEGYCYDSGASITIYSVGESAPSPKGDGTSAGNQPYIDGIRIAHWRGSEENGWVEIVRYGSVPTLSSYKPQYHQRQTAAFKKPSTQTKGK